MIGVSVAAVVAEGAAQVWLGPELNKRADRLDPAVYRSPGERGASVGVCIDAGAKLDEEVDRVDAVGLRGPHERFVEYFLGVVGALPGGESTVGTVEAAHMWVELQMLATF